VSGERVVPAQLGYRIPAEWEPHRGTWLSWPHKEASWPGKFEPVPGIFADMVRVLADREEVHVNVAGPAMEAEVRELLADAGAGSGNVFFHYHPTNDAWCRDHGPTFLQRTRDGIAEQAIVDWGFNAWGGKYPPYDLDDVVPSRIGAELGLPVFEPGIVMEGGAFDVNGRGTLLTTESCLLNPNRNPRLGRGEIEQYLRDYLGVTHILWLGDGIAGDDTDGHVDDITRFVDPRTVEAGDARIEARRFVLATGSSAFVPPIAGLDQVPYLTNETVFARVAEIRDLIVLGGGPIGVELAQGFARLGAKVQLVEMARLLPRDDAEAVELVRASLVRDGVVLHEAVLAGEAQRAGDRIRVAICGASGEAQWLEAAHLLVAVGRRPRVADMGLDKAGIAATPKGIAVDAGLRTSNRRVYAIGDCTGGPAFTHAAGHQAGLVIRSALFRLPVRFDARALPWVTYSDPELAQLGLTEQAARQAAADIVVTHQPFAGNDRARAERHDDGFMKVVNDRRGRVLGVTIVGVQAGELLAPWCLAMARGLKLSAMADLLLPYPTLGEVSKRVAGQYYAPRLFGAGTRRLVGALLRLP